MNKPKFLDKNQMANMAANAAMRVGVKQNVAGMDLEYINKNGEDMKCTGQVPLFESGVIVPDQFIACEGEIFVDAYRQKYVSPILSTTGQQTIAALMIGKICVACGKVFSPDEWLAKRNKNVEEGIQDKRDGGLLDGNGNPIK